jgi:hypothetical protein
VSLTGLLLNLELAAMYESVQHPTEEHKALIFDPFGTICLFLN